ncbi:MAG: VOC family protein [Gammaproteobacteria bacterium]|nr:VOC family protein [Gammaproteobacteria bacterium]
MKFLMDHIVIRANDIAGSVNYYSHVLEFLGFVKIRDHVYQRNGFYLYIREADDKQAKRLPAQTGVDHIGFTASGRGDIDELAESMSAAGFSDMRLIEFDNGDYALFLSDPDGIRIEVTHYADSA